MIWNSILPNQKFAICNVNKPLHRLSYSCCWHDLFHSAHNWTDPLRNLVCGVYHSGHVWGIAMWGPQAPLHTHHFLGHIFQAMKTNFKMRTFDLNCKMCLKNVFIYCNLQSMLHGFSMYLGSFFSMEQSVSSTKFWLYMQLGLTRIRCTPLHILLHGVLSLRPPSWYTHLVCGKYLACVSWLLSLILLLRGMSFSCVAGRHLSIEYSRFVCRS